MSHTLEQDGFEIRSRVLRDEVCDELINAIESLDGAAKSGRAGKRNLLAECPAMEALAHSLELQDLVRPFLGNHVQPVRVLYFDKQPEANWGVPWHQDLAIAVAEQINTPGYTGWSVKDGVPHVHPPADVLEQMLTLRIHLDECSENNGPLRVIPRSHRTGKLNSAQIRHWQTRNEPATCLVPRGGVLLMRPLLLHASSPALTPYHRRVIHIEYAALNLPNGLRWFANSLTMTPS